MFKGYMTTAKGNVSICTGISKKHKDMLDKLMFKNGMRHQTDALEHCIEIADKRRGNHKAEIFELENQIKERNLLNNQARERIIELTRRQEEEQELENREQSKKEEKYPALKLLLTKMVNDGFFLDPDSGGEDNVDKIFLENFSMKFSRENDLDFERCLKIAKETWDKRIIR